MSGRTDPGAASDTLIHPELRFCLADLLAGAPDLPGDEADSLTPAQTRDLLAYLRDLWIPDVSHVPSIARAAPVSRVSIPSPSGAADVAALVINLGKGPPRPAILHMHGGGFVSGRAEHFLPILQAQALALGCVIVTVDYRLAPETAFPGPLDDCYAALEWLHANADELGVDPARIAVQGESAGGGLAASLTIVARDRGHLPVAFQCLIYPMLDDRTGSTRQPPPHVGHYCWTAKTNRMGWSAYLGLPAGSVTVPTGAVPARADNLKDLPPALVWVGALDLFFNESLDYARRLGNAGVPVEAHAVPGVFHVPDLVAPAAKVTIDQKLTIINALAAALEVTPHPDTLELLTPSAQDADR